MRSYLPHYDVRSPRTLAEALELLFREPGRWRPFAGGTDLMVLLEAGKVPYTRFINLWPLDELRGIEATGNAVALGALTTYTDVRQHALLHTEFPLLGRAAAETGGIATQNRGTLAGNVANASPAADTPPALLVYDAELELVSARGARHVAYDRFHTGYKTMDLAGDEIIRAIRLPRGKREWAQTYRKVGTRQAQAISKVCFAAAATLDHGVVEDVRIAFGSVAPVVVRAALAEQALRGRPLDDHAIGSACAALARDISPIDDMRSTARYRLTVAQRLLEEFLSSLR